MHALREPLGDMRELFYYYYIIYYEAFLYFFPNQFSKKIFFLRSGVTKSGGI